ncbi:tyrosine-type recombinase/integrase [Bacillus sp. CRB-7]|uniref:tyrosine-type recombinase/integrase n=1 Tax=Bacillus sp. CRB-7 TaxID=2874284 RepID=UPI0021E2083B|nr:tyrosine-type recombinase/integrase [Bacillus sp. CRB-7]
MEGKPDDDYLFRQRDFNKPMSRQYAHKMLSEAAKKVGIKDRISTHSLRKALISYVQTN